MYTSVIIPAAGFGEADVKARKAVRHALKAPGRPVVVVTGCLAAIDGDGLRALGERVVREGGRPREPEIPYPPRLPYCSGVRITPGAPLTGIAL